MLFVNCYNIIVLALQISNIINAPLAQLVEHLTLNQGVQGSNPWRCTQSTVFNALASGTVFFCTWYFYTKFDHNFITLIQGVLKKSFPGINQITLFFESLFYIIQSLFIISLYRVIMISCRQILEWC